MAQTVPETVRVEPEIRRFTANDSRVFGIRLVVLVLVSTGAVVWIVRHGWLAALPAQLVLGVMFAHAVELQHQALHGTGLHSKRLNRWVGVALGLPMLVAFSRYRALHMLHHRYLGTDQDTEFFQYPYNDRLSFGHLLASAFNVKRWLIALRDMLVSLKPGQTYDDVITGEQVMRRIRAEYRLMLALLLGLLALGIWTGNPMLLTLWLIPLCFAEPVHFAIELPEHLFCDRTSQDVFQSTRSIAGSWFSRWLTNANNLHVEHHLWMATPMNRLPEVHTLVQHRIQHQSRTYWEFYSDVLRRARRGNR